MSERIGKWTQIYGGRMFWPMDPRPAEIHIEDIAHALSLICRFGGHCKEFYSVAEHSVRVSQLLPPELALDGLLHDAAEAYIGDMVRPLKAMLPEYCSAEDLIRKAIAARYGINPIEPPEVTFADNVMLATEARDLLHAPPAPWLELPPPLPERVWPQIWPDMAEKLFLRQFTALGGRER